MGTASQPKNPLIPLFLCITNPQKSSPLAQIVNPQRSLKFGFSFVFLCVLCTTIRKNLRGLRRIIPCDTSPKILRFLRFLRVVLLVAAMPRCG